MGHIDTLPDELLIEIFQTYINFEPPNRLLRISHRWNAIAITTSTLWVNFLLWDIHSKTRYPREVKSGCRTIEDRWDNRIQCCSIPELVQAINRGGESKFSLFISMRSQNALSSNHQALLREIPWSRRCRELKLLHWGPHHLLIYMSDLSALERIEIAGYGESSSPAVRQLLRTLQSTSQNLHHLRIFISDRVRLQPFHDIFTRPASLHLDISSFEEAKRAVAAAESVESLGIHFYHHRPDRMLVCPSEALRVLVLDGIRLQARTIFTNIEHLTIQNQRSDVHLSIELARLTRLTVVQCWSAIAKFQAPQLQLLELYGYFHYTEESLRALKQATIRPPKVDIDMGIPEIEVQRLLEELCKDTVGLQIAYIKRSKSLQTSFASAFRKTVGEEQVCPNLKRLVFLSRRRSHGNEQVSIQLLKEIIDERRTFATFEEAQYGWYDLAQSGNSLRQAQTQWVNVIEF